MFDYAKKCSFCVSWAHPVATVANLSGGRLGIRYVVVRKLRRELLGREAGSAGQIYAIFAWRLAEPLLKELDEVAGRTETGQLGHFGHRVGGFNQ